MTTKQAAKIGIVLAGLYIFANGLFGGVTGLIIILTARPIETAQISFLLLVSAMVVLVVLMALVPCWWLIKRRDIYAERWFGDDQQIDEGSIDEEGLLRVGLVLIAVVMLIFGIISVPTLLGLITTETNSEAWVTSMRFGLGGIGKIIFAILIFRYRSILASKLR